MIYDERPLAAAADKSARVIRQYRTVEFERLLGERKQKAEIRPEVRRMVVLRSERGKKAPFSPDGPLTWNEIDVVRTDLFSPALVAALLPGKEVRPGGRWNAGTAALHELTDLDPIEEGSLTVELQSIVTLNQRKLAKLAISGNLKGANEDGPNRQKLEGTAFFDVNAARLTYLKIAGTQELLGSDGKPSGRLDGTLTLTREESSKFAEIATDSLKGMTLEPNEENSLLLYDNPDLGVRFRYPRRWRVGVRPGQTLTLDEPGGAGILMTVEALANLPSAEKYRADALAYFKNQKANAQANGEIQRTAETPAKVDRFTLDVELSTGKARVEYAVGGHR